MIRSFFVPPDWFFFCPGANHGFLVRKLGPPRARESKGKDVLPLPVLTSVSTSIAHSAQGGLPEHDAEAAEITKAGDPEWLPVPASASFNF